MTENKTTGWQVLALTLLIPFEATLSGFVIVKLWAWFVVTTWGLRPLRISQALGLSLLIHYATNSTSDAKEKRSTAEAVGISIFFPLFILFFGWIYHLFL
jgi:hypothetical protein